MNDVEFSRRARPFFAAINRFTDVKVTAYKTIEEFTARGDFDPESDVVFFQVVMSHIDLLKALRIPMLRKRVIVLSVADVPFYNHRLKRNLTDLISKLKTPILDITGKGINDNTIAGFGFIPLINNLQIFGNVPFSDRSSEFRFAGSIWAGRQHGLLSEFKQVALTNYTLFNSKGIKVQEELQCDLGSNMNYGSYLRDMGWHKFCLVPLGYGSHTFRFLEIMAVGSLVISDDISHLVFNKDYFSDGHNYLSVGKNHEHIGRVVRLCKEQPEEVELIAQRGRETYLEHFKLSRWSCAPMFTVANILNDINRALGQMFFRFMKM